MQAHRIEAILDEDGVITLGDMPFRRGDSVEVIVLQFPGSSDPASRYSLRGTPVRLDSPTEPVSENDWEAVK